MIGAIISNEWANGNVEHVVWKGIKQTNKQKTPKNPTSRKDLSADFSELLQWIKCSRRFGGLW